MNIVQLIPQWLRSKIRKPAPQKIITADKKERQVLPTLPKQKNPLTRWHDDDSPAGYRILWRL